MKSFMYAVATFLTLTAFSPAQADEISVMFQPEGGSATDSFGVEFGEDSDGTTLMCIKGEDSYHESLFETIENVVKNGISGSITAIFSTELDRKNRGMRERILFFGDSTRDGRYFLWGYTHDHQLIRWYIPKKSSND